jgi:hypothetical protein
VTLPDGSTLVAYAWDAAENFWPEASAEHPAFADATGEQLFIEAHSTLRSMGIRTLDIVERGEGLILVEDLVGGSLEDVIRGDLGRAEAAVMLLRQELARLHGVSSTGVGKIGSVVRSAETCERIAHDRAVRHLAEARARRPELPEALIDALSLALNRVEPRDPKHALIHGELGPDHVYLDRDDLPVLIDIEGLMHFDIEWEHAFMAFRFGSMYKHLRPTGLDPSRLNLYTLCLRISLIAGPLRLLDGDFPHRAAMLAIVESNIEAALKFLP